MVQFNLLPEVKVEFIKARRQKHLITTIATITTLACVGLFVVAFLAVNVGQKQYLKVVDKNIQTRTAELKKVPDINKMLTVQNQLGRLTQLHEDKPVTSRTFDYLSKMTPANVRLTKVTIDQTDTSLKLGGIAPSLDDIRVFADTLKSATYQSDTDEIKAFSEVALSQFSRQEDGTAFTLSMKFDPVIFKGTQTNSTLNVPANAGASKENVFQETQ